MFCRFVLGIVIGTLLASLFYMIFCSLLSLVAGEQHSFFSSEIFFRGIFVSSPLIISAVLVSLVLFGIRQPSNPIIKNITYILFGLLSWLFLIPLNFELFQSDSPISISEPNQIQSEQKSLSVGYFRPAESGVVYFSEIKDDGKSDGIFIDTEGISGKQGAVIQFFDSQVDLPDEEFADVLMKNSLSLSPVVSIPMKIYSRLFSVAQSKYNEGKIAWLIFATFGLALISVWGIGKMTSWKLLNAVFTLTLVFLIVLLNFLYYSGRIKLSIFILNICVAAIFFALGFIIPIFKPKRQE